MLARHILERLHELRMLSAAADKAVLRGSGDHVLLIKAGKEHFLLLSPVSCLD